MHQLTSTLVLKQKLYPTLPAHIRVPNVQTFSYGQDDTASVILWAAGAAGWFELSPSKAYKTLYKHDCEAIGCLYFIADLYRGLKGKRRRDLRVEDIFRLYAEEGAHRCRSVKQAEEIFRRHKPFLKGCAEAGKEGLNWKRTAMYKFLEEEVDDEVMADADEIPAPQTPPSDSRDPRARHAGKGRSTLRPSSKKHKGPSRSRTDDEELEDTTTVQTPTTTPSIPLKRKGPAIAGGRSMRARHTAPSEDEDIDVSFTTTIEPDPVTEARSPDTTPSGNTIILRLPFKTNPRPQQKRPTSPSIRLCTTKVPSYEATHPGDIWSCPFDGCTTRIYAASTPDSRQLIKDHYQVHAFDAQAQIDLIQAEERPYLPVGNLINKIREMAARREEKGAPLGAVGRGGGAGGGMEQFLPKPIAQRY